MADSNDSVTLVSTTDSPEEVQAALTGVPVPEKVEAPAAPAPEPAAKVDEKPAADAKPAVDAKPAADAPPAAAETPEQKLERERTSSRERRTNKIQSEIDKATKAKYDAQRAAEIEEARLAGLRAEVAALEGRKAAGATPPAAAAPPPTNGAVAPKLDDVDASGNAKFASYEDWVSANAQFHAEQAAERVATRKAAETVKTIDDKQIKADRARIVHDTAIREEQEALATYQTRLEDFRSRTPDFDATYEAGKEFVTELVEAMGPDVMNVMHHFTTRDAENGPAITHHLLKNPDELRRIAALPVPQQIAALARIDARLEAATKEPARPPVAPVTQAPEPIKPVGGAPTASTVSSEDEDYRTFAARRNREERERAGVR